MNNHVSDEDITQNTFGFPKKFVCVFVIDDEGLKRDSRRQLLVDVVRRDWVKSI
jgi:hypothetical protein